MFRGIFETTVDGKVRTSLPAKFREVLLDTFGDERFFITNSTPVGLGSGAYCSGLLIFPYNEWLKFEEGLLNSKGFTSDQRNSVMRRIVAPAVECSADKLGRVLVPPHLRKSAALERDILFVGALKKIEVWSQAEWDKVRAQDDQNFPGATEALAELGL